MICSRELLAMVVIFVVSHIGPLSTGCSRKSYNVTGLHSTDESFAHQIGRRLNPSSVLGHYHPTVLVLP